MALAYINLTAKQYINFMCRTDFDRRIFHDTYKEFQELAADYNLNAHLHTFAQICQANTHAYTLHHKLHCRVSKTISSLNQKMPLVNDTSGKSILFQQAELHILSSDLRNKGNHVVSITYTSPRLVLHEMVGDVLILSYDKKGTFNPTFMVKITAELEINYEQQAQLAYN